MSRVRYTNKTLYDNLDNDTDESTNPLYDLQSEGGSVAHINWFFELRHNDFDEHENLFSGKEMRWYSAHSPVVRFTPDGLVVEKEDPRPWTKQAFSLWTRLSTMREDNPSMWMNVTFIQDDVPEHNDFFMPQTWYVYLDGIHHKFDYMEELDEFLTKKGY